MIKASKQPLKRDMFSRGTKKFDLLMLIRIFCIFTKYRPCELDQRLLRCGGFSAFRGCLRSQLALILRERDWNIDSVQEAGNIEEFV